MPDKRPAAYDSRWVPTLLKYGSRAQVWCYRRTGGRIGGHWRIGAGFRKPVPVLLLEHVGRKSGRRFTTPLLYLVHGEDMVVVASQGGLPKHPQWYRNLMASPDAQVQVGRDVVPVRAHRADSDEKAVLWPRLVDLYADFATYQEWAGDREIPVVVLEPRTRREVVEREITAPVSLTTPAGRLNRDAVGWSRTPQVVTDGVGRGRTGRGRNKRWEYWAVTTPTHVVAMTVSDIDYAAVHSLWLLDRATGEEIATDAIGMLGRSATLPGTLGRGPVRARTKRLQIDVEEVTGGSRLRASGDRVSLDVVAHRPEGHESLAVVVPWTDRLFQYTVKDVARPATGTVWVDGAPYDVPAGDSWAVLDHGRGRWPYSVHWNWGAGAGRTDGRTIGVQVGGKWTDGTGSVENSLLVDGRLTKIGEELAWDYDPGNWMAPWRVRGEAVDLTLTPFHVRKSVTDLAVFSSRTHQCFGHWSGHVRDESGDRIRVADVVGWAEDVRNRW